MLRNVAPAMKPLFKVPTINISECLNGTCIAFWYALLSIGLAFLCHRICFYNTPLVAAFSSKFSAVIFVLTMIGLYKWMTFRVFVLLLVPKLCNINGRTLVMAYIAYLTITGPVVNTQKNIGVMCTSLVCSYEEILLGYHELVEMASQPIVHIKKIIDHLESEAKEIFKKLAKELEDVQKYAQNLSRWIGL